jgi:hypothetical protein
MARRALRDPYVLGPFPEWHPYDVCGDLCPIWANRRSSMLDIIYLALGAGGFAALMLCVRALARL